MSGTADYDPDRHDNQVVALFEDRSTAERARDALLNAGLPAEAITLLDQRARSDASAHTEHGEAGHWAAMSGMIAPEADRHAISHAIGRGHAMVLVHPHGARERETAIEVLESLGPVEVGSGPDTPPSVDHQQLNHAAVSRADMAGHALPGRDQTVLDMTGKPMTVRVLDEHDIAAVPDATHLPPAQPRPEIVAAAAAEATAGDREHVSYTYGIPEEIARAMTVDERIAAQTPAETADGRRYVRVVEERIGWRERNPRATRVRSYVAERPQASSRVELREEDIGPANGK